MIRKRTILSDTINEGAEHDLILTSLAMLQTCFLSSKEHLFILKRLFFKHLWQFGFVVINHLFEIIICELLQSGWGVMDDFSGVEKGLMDWVRSRPHPLFEPFVVVTKEVHLHYFVKMNIAPLVFPDIAAMLAATR